ncbi:DUF4430 domain-containing protein [Facklamia miroungae]|uniref:Transcobalamin-like C-terminal domain-containing protein n=1 Tax=Facklamia miroungae TaxID=120956 RepID=A0A1G7RHX0_9LACT|nr:DUF4430 domain-containing protein [Facklamia miroungae]NKZ29406.1 DUF4430 domain-containing protein [Facklamia miroungae]SDG10387.1 protein of unknown function [Facklamia miroungae]
MKKILQVSTIIILAIFLTACDKLPGNKKASVENAPTEETTTSESTPAETTADVDKTTTEETTVETPTNDAQGQEGTATIIINQENGSPLEYQVNNIGGVSVLEAMSAIEELEFNFNEDEGVVDVIEGVENDYAPNTWMYLINKQFAELGVVSQKLEDGDEIEWYYGTIDDIPVTIIPAQEADTTDPA